MATNIVKRIHLTGLFDGWDDTCFAVVKPATVKERLETSELDVKTMTKSQMFTYQVEFVKTHFVSGKVKGYDADNDSFTDSKLTMADVEESSELCDLLYMRILGLNYDPKDLLPVVESVEAHQSSAAGTKKQSSTAADQSPTQ